MESSQQLLTPLMIENDTNEECTICYESYNNKAYVNDCLHNFCYVCIVSWAKIKPVCPLCVRPITGIITNIRSWNEYDIHSVDPPAYDLYASSAALSDFGIPSDDTDTDSSYGGMESMISDFDYLQDNDDLSAYLTEEEDHSEVVSVNSPENDNCSVDNSYDEEDDKDDTDSDSSQNNEEDTFWNTEYDDDADDDDNDNNDEEDNDEESEDDEGDSDMFYDNEFAPSDDNSDNEDENEDDVETSVSEGSTSYSGDDSDGYNDNYAASEPLESENEYAFYNYCNDSNSIDSADEFGYYCGDSDDLCAYDDSPDYISSSNYY